MNTPGRAVSKNAGPGRERHRVPRTGPGVWIRDDRIGQDANGDADSVDMLGAASLGAASLGAATGGCTVAAGLDPPAGVHAMRAAPRARERSKRVHTGKYLLGFDHGGHRERGDGPAGECQPTS